MIKTQTHNNSNPSTGGNQQRGGNPFLVMFQFVSYSITDSIGTGYFTICSSLICEHPMDAVNRFFPEIIGKVSLTRFYLASKPMHSEEIQRGESSSV